MGVTLSYLKGTLRMHTSKASLLRGLFYALYGAAIALIVAQLRWGEISLDSIASAIGVALAIFLLAAFSTKPKP